MFYKLDVKSSDNFKNDVRYCVIFLKNDLRCLMPFIYTFSKRLGWVQNVLKVHFRCF